MENILFVELSGNVGEVVVFWINKLRFEGKILDCDSVYLKYFDSHKNKERFVKISEIENLEVQHG